MTAPAQLGAGPRGDLNTAGVQIPMTVVAHTQIVCLALERVQTNTLHLHPREGDVAVLAHIGTSDLLLDFEVDRVFGKSHDLDIGRWHGGHLGMAFHAVLRHQLGLFKTGVMTALA